MVRKNYLIVFVEIRIRNYNMIRGNKVVFIVFKEFVEICIVLLYFFVFVYICLK